MSRKNIVRTFLGLGIFVLLFVIFIKVCNKQGKNQFEDLSEAQNRIYTVGEAKGKEKKYQDIIGQYTVNDLSKPNLNDKKKAKKNRLKSGLSKGSKRHLSSVKPVKIKDLSEIRTKAGFFENKGQFQNEQIDFVLKRQGLRMVLKGDAIQYQLLYEEQSAAGSQYFTDIINLAFVGSNSNPTIETFGESVDKHNYFLGAIKATDVHHFKQVLYKDLYPGIDVLFEAFDPASKSFGAKYSFVVHPNADPGQIKVKYTGQKGLSTTESTGDRNFVDVADLLEIGTSGGAIGEKISSIYTVDKNDNKAFVPGQFVKKDGLIEYDIDTYDRSKMLVIDPEVVTLNLRRSTYYGSEGTDRLQAVSSDSEGNIVVAGVTPGVDSEMVRSTGGFQDEHGGSSDMVVAKFKSDLSELIVSTYLGGGDSDNAFDIQVADTGDVFIVGNTSSSNFPSDNFGGSYSSKGKKDGIIAKLNSDLSQLSWSTGIGGDEDDELFGLSIGDNFIYVTGYVKSSNLSTDATGLSGSSDAILSRLNQKNGNSDWITYFGGDRGDEGKNIVINTNKIYLGGSTNDDGDDKAFICQFNSDGSFVAEAKYGNDDVECNNVVISQSGDKIALIGVVNGEDDYANDAGFVELKHQSEYGGDNEDGFVIVVNSSDFSVVWSTYYGGEELDNLYGGAFDCNDNLLVTGYSRSENNINENGFINEYQGGGETDKNTGDAILVKFDEKGNRYWGSYFGSDGDEEGVAIVYGKTGNIILCGASSSTSGIATESVN